VAGLAKLLELQELDLSADRLRIQLENLPEAQELAEHEALLRELDAALAAGEAQREELSRAERELGSQVAAAASKAKEVETTLYSGTVKIPKELAALQEDHRLLRQRQAELEDRELERLEVIETVEGAIEATRSRRAEVAARAAELEAAIRAARDEIRGELARIKTERGARAAGLPAPVLEVYDRLRDNPRLGGRAAAPLGKGVCGGCRIQLPMMESSRIRAEAPDSVVCCVGCGRLLVR